MPPPVGGLDFEAPDKAELGATWVIVRVFDEGMCRFGRRAQPRRQGERVAEGTDVLNIHLRTCMIRLNAQVEEQGGRKVFSCCVLGCSVPAELCFWLHRIALCCLKQCYETHQSRFYACWASSRNPALSGGAVRLPGIAMTEEGEKPEKPAPKKWKKASAERAKKGDGDAATPTPKRQKTAKAREPKAQAAKEQGKL